MTSVDDVLASDDNDDDSDAIEWQGTPGADDDMPETSPLARLLMENAEVVDNTIAMHGPGFVANWFMNVGAMIAAQYDLTATGDDETPFQ